jgi:phospholipid/cholesterol/gamma-HCH transport system substrate-binding protein
MNLNKETAVGLFVAVGLLCTAYLTVRLGRMEILGDDGYTLNAQFTSVSGLRTGAEVEIAGVRVGRVATIALDAKHPVATITLRMNKGVAVYDDAIASIKTSGLIGDKYVNISPGGGGEMLDNGGTIGDTEPDVDLITLISKYVFGKV